MANPNATALAYRSETLAAKLPTLLIAAERVAATVAQGAHGRRRVGLGEAFWQFRGYEPGDPPQRIDWRRSAKSDRVFVRQTEWETAQTVWLWRDGSASMRYRSAPSLPEKRERAELLVLALANLLLRGGERVALIGSGLGPSSGLRTTERMALALLREPDPRSLPAPTVLPRFSQIVLCGDMNIARTEMDVHPKERKPNAIGQRPEERALFETLLGDQLVDLGRAFDPDNPGLFTWWAPWRNLRARNIGWRLDYVLTQPAVAARASDCVVLTEVGTSDHAPVVMTMS